LITSGRSTYALWRQEPLPRLSEGQATDRSLSHGCASPTRSRPRSWASLSHAAPKIIGAEQDTLCQYRRLPFGLHRGLEPAVQCLLREAEGGARQCRHSFETRMSTLTQLTFRSKLADQANPQRLVRGHSPPLQNHFLGVREPNDAGQQHGSAERC